jgi:hypothetical protein
MAMEHVQEFDGLVGNWDGKLWSARVDGLPDGMVVRSQGHTLDEAAARATDAVALALDVPIAMVRVTLTIADWQESGGWRRRPGRHARR